MQDYIIHIVFTLLVLFYFINILFKVNNLFNKFWIYSSFGFILIMVINDFFEPGMLLETIIFLLVYAAIISPIAFFYFKKKSLFYFLINIDENPEEFNLFLTEILKEEELDDKAIFYSNEYPHVIKFKSIPVKKRTVICKKINERISKQKFNFLSTFSFLIIGLILLAIIWI